jgi:hypothetical protein
MGVFYSACPNCDDGVMVTTTHSIPFPTWCRNCEAKKKEEDERNKDTGE